MTPLTDEENAMRIQQILDEGMIPGQRHGYYDVKIVTKGAAWGIATRAMFGDREAQAFICSLREYVNQVQADPEQRCLVCDGPFDENTPEVITVLTASHVDSDWNLSMGLCGRCAVRFADDYRPPIMDAMRRLLNLESLEVVQTGNA
jgi:hypothetical protein